jgi:hypothetical protein
VKSITTQILVFLPEEAVDTWRPVDAQAVGPGIYRIVSPNPDPDDEVWEFKSGDVVRCEERPVEGSERRLVAIAKVERTVQSGPPRKAYSSRWRKFWWPKIDGPAAAEDAMGWGYVTAVSFVILIMLDVARGSDRWLLALILAGFWGALAWGIRRASRVAACAGLGVSLSSLLLTWPPTPPTPDTTPTWVKALSVLVLSLFFVNGIRGAFAVHKYRADAGPDSSTSI